MNVLVAGSSGFIGKSLLKTLLNMNHQIVALYRTTPIPQERNLFPVMVELSNQEHLRSILRSIDVVIYLAWDFTKYFDNAQDSRYSENLKYLQSMVRAMEEVKVRRLILLSSIHANQEASDGHFHEKYHAECLVLNSQIEEKVVIKSDVVWDHRGDYLINGLRNVMKFPVYPVLNEDFKVYPIHVQDLVDAIIQAMQDECKFSSTIRNFIGVDVYTVNELFNLVKSSIDGNLRLPLKRSLGKYFFQIFQRISKSKLDKRFLLWYQFISKAENSTPDLFVETIRQKQLLSDFYKQEPKLKSVAEAKI